jgi:hypothetical protein
MAVMAIELVLGAAISASWAALWALLLQVKGTDWDTEENPATITPESVADDFWELYSKRDPDTWFVKRG